MTAYDFREYNPFRFSSEYADNALGLVYYNYRHYEPVIGRWMSRDPFVEKGSLSLYLYLSNQSNFFDFLGLASLNDRINGFVSKLEAAKSAIQAAEQCMSTVREAFRRRDNGTYDKLNHCISSCEISTDCGNKISYALGFIKEVRDLWAGNLEEIISWVIPKSWEEWLHEHLQGGGFQDSVDDFMANFQGFDCQSAPEGCECCCKEKFK